MQPLYDPEAVRPLWEELVNVGFHSLTTAEEVDEVLSKGQGTVLLVINSVCGCAAGAARPGVELALQHKTIPDKLVTVFAGVDRAAVERAREYMPQFEPSSPFIVLFKDGKEVFTLERRHIESMDVHAIAEILKRTFDEFCRAPGPSVPPEVYEKTARSQQCSSTIPLFRPS
jgi:putative YphP/YqiW family bacilliredoxin